MNSFIPHQNGSPMRCGALPETGGEGVHEAKSKI